VSDRDRSAELKQLAHDVRNALNGVSVNLEVARSRAQRGVDITQVASFIETAAQQLETATRLHKRYTDVVSDMAAGTASPHDSAPARPAPDDTHSHL
jgi:hypothetical protein